MDIAKFLAILIYALQRAKIEDNICAFWSCVNFSESILHINRGPRKQQLAKKSIILFYYFHFGNSI